MFGKSVFLTLALMAAATASFAQRGGDAGVSGIPNGPGSAGGLNNSVNDPSGIGNVPKAPQIPPAANSTVPNASGFPPAANRISPTTGVVVTRGPRRAVAASRRRSPVTEAAVRAQDKLLERKLKSICTGC